MIEVWVEHKKGYNISHNGSYECRKLEWAAIGQVFLGTKECADYLDKMQRDYRTLRQDRLGLTALILYSATEPICVVYCFERRVCSSPIQ